jgi:hypothetical protein
VSCRACGTHWGEKSEGKRSLGRPGHRLEDNKMGFHEWGGKMWTGFAFLRIGTSVGLYERGSMPWVALFVCFHGRPWQSTDVLQPAGLLYRPLWTFQL